MVIMQQMKQSYCRNAVIFFSLFVCCVLTYYFHQVLARGTVVSHFFYIPIVLAALWWRRKGIFVAFFSSAYLILSHFIFRIEVSPLNDFSRALMMFFVSFTLVFLSEKLFYLHNALESARVQLSDGIKKRKAAESDLRRIEARYRNILSGAIDPVILIDYKNGKIVEFNSAACSMLGYASDELCALNMSEIEQDFILREGKFLYESKYRTKDNLLLDMLVCGRSFSLDGESFILCICRDITRKKRMAAQLNEYSALLDEQKRAIEQKDAALREIICQIEQDKKQIHSDIVANIEEIVLPSIDKLRVKGLSSRHIKLLRKNLEDITSSFGRRISQRDSRLTPREIEICSMVKNGLSNKEIATLLNISLHTVEKHRMNIRKKLDIANKDLNLVSFLQAS